jgi:uncharacterized protein (TIGR02145 family)
MLNQQIGPYRITHLLGEGGMAQVYLAEKGNLGKKVALKVLKREFLYNNHIRGRFLAEAKNMIQLNHPNIVGVQDLIDEPDFVAIELEYIEGETLKQYLERKGALPDTEIERLIEQMWSAVSYIHQKGFVHRDIKPSNFMLTSSGVIKLTDFGIAKNMDGTNSDYTGTGTGMVLGTPKYMSPEQVRNTKDVNAQSDIYSLGVVLWEMITGRVPYDINTESTFDVFEKIVRQPLAKTGSKWDAVIEKATMKKSTERTLDLKFLDIINEDETKRNDKTLMTFLVATIGVSLLIIFGSLWFEHNSKEDSSEWKEKFEEQWTAAEQVENNKNTTENIETYTLILETLPNDAIDEKNKVQRKIDHFKTILAEAEIINERDRIEEEDDKERKKIEVLKPEEKVEQVVVVKPVTQVPVPTEKTESQTIQSSSFTDSRDGKAYKWVKIGNQVWMAQNLAYKPQKGNYWAYDNKTENVAKYGYLYDWETACKVCPSGWHLPSDAEWSVLINYLGGVNLASYKMKSTWAWRDGGNGNNVSGFNGLPGGYCDDKKFGIVGDFGYWWSSTEFDAGNAWYRPLYYNNGYVGRDASNKANGFSVRCLRD